MAITSLDGALAGMKPPNDFCKGATPTLVAGRPHSLFYLGGWPGAAIAPTPGIGGAALTTYPGQLPWANPGAGNSYLARLQAMCTIPGTLLLCDRLWHNSGISNSITTEQTFTGSATIPARDNNGAQVGDGVYAALEIYTASTANTPTLTLKYKNQAGATVTANSIDSAVAATPIGAFLRFPLNAGETGIQNAVSFTMSTTWTTVACGIVLYRILARLELCAAFTPNAIDALTSGFVRLYDNTVPFLVFIPSTTTASNISGHMIVTQG